MTKAEQEAYRLKRNEQKRQWRLNQKKGVKQVHPRLKRIGMKPLEDVHRNVDAMPPLTRQDTQKMLRELEGIKSIKADDPFDAPATKYVEDTSPLPNTPKQERVFTETEVRGMLTQAITEKRAHEQPEPVTRRQRRAFARRHVRNIYHEMTPEGRPSEPLEVVAEQVERPQTTRYSPESITEENLREVKRNPEYYIEINMVTDSRVVDTFFIPSEYRKFHYKEKEYEVDEETIYLLPTKLGPFMPTCHYKEGTTKPKGFKQTNKGITGKAMSLLYMEQLYTSLLYSEDVKYNLFIVILSIAGLIVYGVGCYLLFAYNGGILPHQAVLNPLPNTGLILPRFLW